MIKKMKRMWPRRKKSFLVFAPLIFMLFGTSLNAQVCETVTLGFGSGDGTFDFSAIEVGGGDITNEATSGANLTNTASFDVIDESGAAPTVGTDGTNDVQFDFGMSGGFDPYGGIVLDALGGTTDDVQQSSSGIRGNIRFNQSSTVQFSTGDVHCYDITVTLPGGLAAEASTFNVELNSVNTCGEVYESTSVVFLDETGAPYGTANYTGFYTSPPTGVPGGSNPPTAAPSAWTTTGTGVYIADMPTVDYTTDIFNPECTTASPPTDGADPNAATDGGLAPSDLVSGFVYTVCYEDIAATAADGDETTSDTQFTSTLNGMSFDVCGPEPEGCVSLTGVCEGDDVTAVKTGGTIGTAGYNTIYYLVNEMTTTVVDAQDTDGPATFTAPAVGCYQIHVLNYDEADAPTAAADLTTITDLAAINDGCYNANLVTDFSCVCVNPSDEKCEGDPFVVNSAGATAGNEQLYILTNAAGTSVITSMADPDLSNATDVDFGPLTAGDYRVYALNYPAGDAPSFLPLADGAAMPDQAALDAATGCFNADFLADFICCTVNPLPTANDAALALCDDGTGMATFTLADAEDATATSNTASGAGEDVDDGATGVTVTYYDTQANADAGMAAGLLTSLSAADGTTVIVRIENDMTACYETATVTLNVLPLPVVSITDPGELCAADPVTVIAGSPAGGTFTATAYIDAAGNFNPALANIDGLSTVTYSYSDANGCMATATFDVSVITCVCTPTDICQGEDIVAVSSGGTPMNLQWYFLVPDGSTTAVAANTTGTFSTTGLTGIYNVHALNFDPNDPPSPLNAAPYGMPVVDGDISNATTLDLSTLTGGCYNTNILSDRVCFDIRALPVVNFVDPGELCADDPATVITANPPGGSFMPTAYIDAAGNFNPALANIDGLSTVTYNYTDGNGCSAVGTLFVSVITCTCIPTELCQNDDIVAVSSGGTPGNLQWYFLIPDGSTTAVDANTTGTFSTTGLTGIYNVHALNFDPNDPPAPLNAAPYGMPVVDGDISNATNLDLGALTGGCYNVNVLSDRVCFDVNPLPIISANGVNPSTCGGSDGSIDLTLTNVANGDYSITYDGGVFPITVFNSVATITGLVSGSYDNLVIINENGCTSIVDIDVTLVDPPIPPAPTAISATYCETDVISAVTATGETGATFSWFTDAALTNAAANVSGLNSQTWTPSGAVGTETVYVVQTVAGCESMPTQVDIVVNANPTVDLGPDVEQCEGNGTITLDAGPNFASYAWSPNGETTQTITIPDTPSDETYAVTVTDGNGCSGSDMVVVTINELPVISVDVNSPTACGASDGSITLDIGITGNAGVYTIDYDGGSFTGVLVSNTGIATITGLPTGVYNNLIITSGGPCPTTEGVDVIITDPVTLDPPLVAGDTYCEGDAITPITATGQNGVVFEWFTDAALTNPITTNLSGGNNQTYTPNGVVGTETVYVIQTLVGCSSGSATQVDIIVNAAPVVDLGTDITQCEGTGAVVLDAGAGFASYSWSTGETSQTITVADAAGAATYSVTVANADGCTGADMIDVTINALPVVDAGAYGPICDSDPAITVTGSPADAGGTWSGTGITDNGDGTASFDPAGLTASSPITLTYDYIDANGCANSATTTVIVETCFVPNIGVSKDDSTPGDADTDGDDTQTTFIGGEATFTITISNTGDEPLCNITIADIASDMGLDISTCQPTFASIDTDNGTVAAGAGDGTLGVGESETIVCTVSGVTQSFTNSVEINAEGCFTGGVVTSTDETEVIAEPFDLAMIKTASGFSDTDGSGGVSPGDNVMFTMSVFNQGAFDAYDIDIIDYFTNAELIYVGSYLSPASSTSPIVTDNGTNGFEVDFLAAGAQTDVIVEFTVNPMFNGTTIMNTAEIVDAAVEDNGPTPPDEDNTIGDGPGPGESDNELNDPSIGGIDDPADNDSFDPEELTIGCGLCPAAAFVDRVCAGNMLYVVDGTNPNDPLPVDMGTIYNWYLITDSGTPVLVASVVGQPYYSPQMSGTYTVEISVGDDCPCEPSFNYEVIEVIDCVDCGN